MTAPLQDHAEVALIERCIRGDRQARNQLAAKYQPILAREISRFAGRYLDQPDRDQKDDIQQEVWSTCFASNCKFLRAFDARVRPFPCYLGCLARNLTLHLSRELKRRRKHLSGEEVAELPARPQPDLTLEFAVEEFLHCLSPALRETLRECLDARQAGRPKSKCHQKRLERVRIRIIKLLAPAE